MTQSTAGTTNAADSKQELSLSDIQAMKKLGFPKPAWVAWSDWMGPKKLTDRHMTIAMLKLQGASQRDIARYLGIDEARISLIMRTRRMQDYLLQLREKYLQKTIDQQFKDIAVKSVKLIDDIISGREPAPVRARLQAAQDILNRAHGKPKETLEVRNNSIRDIYVYLDNMRNGTANSALDFSPSPAQSDTIETTANEVVESAPVQESTKKDEYREFDRWVSENIPDDYSIGKTHE